MEKKLNGYKLSQEEFLERLNEVHNGMIEALEEYKNARTPMKFFCHYKDENGEEHGEFEKTPYEVVNLGRKCSKCYNTLPFGYWNDLNHCLEEASHYQNKNELEKKRYGCYHSFLRNGWMDKLDELYSNKIIQYRNMEEKIHSVYVYEIKDLNTCYVGRTNNIKRRDRQHRNGDRHSDGRITHDCLWKFCNKNKIDIPKPIILEENLNASGSQKQEEYWLEKYEKDGWKTLNTGVVGVNRGSLGAYFKWTYEKCKEIALQCKNKEEFKKVNQSAHNSARKNGWINDFFIQKKRPNGYWDNLENCMEEAKKYRNLKEFAEKGKGAYNAARKNGFIDKLMFNK